MALPYGLLGKNSVANSPWGEWAAMLLRNGQNLSEVQRALREKGFETSIPTLSKFKEALDEQARRNEAAGLPLDAPSTDDEWESAVRDVPTDKRIMNDGELLDLIIQKFMQQMKTGTAEVSAVIALKAISMKKEMLGSKYKGQTVWSLMEAQLQFDQLIKILEETITHDQFELVMDKMARAGLVTTQRPKPIAMANKSLDRMLDREADVKDPLLIDDDELLGK